MTAPDSPQNIDADQMLNEVYPAYLNRVIGLARKNLSSQLQMKVDAEDIAQSVFRTFARRFQLGQFQGVVNNASGLWNLLAHLTVTRCHKTWQHYKAQKRDPARETTLRNFKTEGEEMAEAEPIVDREPSPEDAAILRETLELCYTEMGVDPQARSVIEAWLKGTEFDAIAGLDGIELSRASIRKLCLAFFDAVLAKVKQEESL